MVGAFPLEASIMEVRLISSKRLLWRRLRKMKNRNKMEIKKEPLKMHFMPLGLKRRILNKRVAISSNLVERVYKTFS